MRERRSGWRAIGGRRHAVLNPIRSRLSTSFLLDRMHRLQVRGFSPTSVQLRMSRTEIGSLLGLKLERTQWSHRTTSKRPVAGVRLWPFTSIVKVRFGATQLLKLADCLRTSRYTTGSALIDRR